MTTTRGSRTLSRMPEPIDAEAAIVHFREHDPALAALIAGLGPFEMRAAFEDPFLALARAIALQQLSGKAAGTIFRRFLTLADPEETGRLDPGRVLSLGDEELRSAGLSRQKMAAIRDLAAHFARAELSTELFEQWANEEIIEHLVRVRGVGRWTVEMYLMFQLGRPDVLPVNDIGVNRAIMKLHGLEAMPKPAEVRRIGEAWSPWATVACWYLWRSEDGDS